MELEGLSERVDPVGGLRGRLFERCAGVGAAVEARHMSAHFVALEAAVCEAASLAPPWLAARCGRALCLRFELLVGAILALDKRSLGLGAASLGLVEAPIGAAPAALLSLSAAEPSRRKGGTGCAASLRFATSDWF